MFTTRPKSLAERLHWMSDNLPGFASELAAAQQASIQAVMPPLQMKTFELGMHESGKILPCYDFFRDRDLDSPWTRVEVEMRNIESGKLSNRNEKEHKFATSSKKDFS